MDEPDNVPDVPIPISELPEDLPIPITEYSELEEEFKEPRYDDGAGAGTSGSGNVAISMERLDEENEDSTVYSSDSNVPLSPKIVLTSKETDV